MQPPSSTDPSATTRQLIHETCRVKGNINKSVVKSCQIVVHSTGHQGALSCQRVLRCWLWTAHHFLDLNPQIGGHNGLRTTSVQWLRQVQSCHAMSCPLITNGYKWDSWENQREASFRMFMVKQSKLVSWVWQASVLSSVTSVPAACARLKPMTPTPPQSSSSRSGGLAWDKWIHMDKWLCEIQTVHLGEPSEARCYISFLTLHQPSTFHYERHTSQITVSLSFFGSRDHQSWHHDTNDCCDLQQAQGNLQLCLDANVGYGRSKTKRKKLEKATWQSQTGKPSWW